MAIDLGDKNIGIAVSDELGLTAQGLPTIKSKGRQNDLDKIKELTQQYQVEQVVVGLPRNMDGTLGPRARGALDFAAKARDYLELPVDTWDERLSTVAARRVLLDADISRAKQRKVVDKLAASIILQDYLQARGKN